MGPSHILGEWMVSELNLYSFIWARWVCSPLLRISKTSGCCPVHTVRDHKMAGSLSGHLMKLHLLHQATRWCTTRKPRLPGRVVYRTVSVCTWKCYQKSLGTISWKGFLRGRGNMSCIYFVFLGFVPILNINLTRILWVIFLDKGHGWSIYLFTYLFVCVCVCVCVCM